MKTAGQGGVSLDDRTTNAIDGGDGKHTNGGGAEENGCGHYVNNCEILAPCCKHWYRCYNCHNEARQDVCGALDKSTIEQLRCLSCGHEQSATSGSTQCRQCKVRLAEYCCKVCRLYRNLDESGIYHCYKCGICRIGKGLGIGGSHWHCDGCKACLPRCVDKHEHKKVCIPNAMKNACPVCFEDMHVSRSPVVQGGMCGHFMHMSCLETYFEHGYYKCPMCQKPWVDVSGLKLNVEERRPSLKTVGLAVFGIVFAAMVFYFR